MPVDIVRDAAIEVMLRIFEKDAQLSAALDRSINRKGSRLSSRGRRFLAQLVYGTIRHSMLADHILKPLLHQPLHKLPFPILLVLRMGVFQALYCDNVTFPAMVHTSVDLAKKHGHAGTAKLVNAVLKKVPQTIEEINFPDPATDQAEYLHIRYSIPLWLVKRWIKEYDPETADALCQSAIQEAPQTIRVNTLLTNREDLLGALAKAEITAIAHPDIPDAITILKGGIPFRSKVFQNGHFYIQDPASMLPSYVLDPQENERILDMCAAPGGKSTHMAELSNGKGHIIANELSPKKRFYMEDNRERLQIPNMDIVIGDGFALPYKQEIFDRVLVDAPCSCLGTLRRHPDLKYRVKSAEIERLSELQKNLLRTANNVCKSEGVIVYSVCTFTPEETTEVVEMLLGEQGLKPEDGPDWLNPWKIGPGMYRTLPHQSEMDGFFIARLRKTS